MNVSSIGKPLIPPVITKDKEIFSMLNNLATI